MCSRASSSIPLRTDTDASQIPLIRDVLKSYPLSSSSTDSHPSSWLDEPAVVEAFRKNMPIGYMKQEKTLLDASGQLLVWGLVKATWRHCLNIEGLKWKTLRTDLLDLFDGHDIIDPPIILGTASRFVALVYMRSAKSCEAAIADLNGAEISREATLRVTPATKADLQKALEIQEQSFRNISSKALP